MNCLLPFPEVISAFGFHYPSKCPYCCHEDTIDHCFFGCHVAVAVWSYFFAKLQLQLSGLEDLFAVLQFCWFSTDIPAPLRMVLQMLPQLICWEIWKMRTAVIYGGGLLSIAARISSVSTLFQMLCTTRPISVSSRPTLALDFVSFSLRRPRLQQVFWRPPVGNGFALNVY